MYKLEFGEELLIIIIIYKIFRDLDLTCIKEFCDPAMILEKEKSCTSAHAHTHTPQSCAQTHTNLQTHIPHK